MPKGMATRMTSVCIILLKMSCSLILLLATLLLYHEGLNLLFYVITESKCTNSFSVVMGCHFCFCKLLKDFLFY